MTNFEHIKSMTEKEFFEFVLDMELYKCNGCPAKPDCGKYDSCPDAFIAWLRDDYKENNNEESHMV